MLAQRRSSQRRRGLRLRRLGYRRERGALHQRRGLYQPSRHWYQLRVLRRSAQRRASRDVGLAPRSDASGGNATRRSAERRERGCVVWRGPAVHCAGRRTLGYIALVKKTLSIALPSLEGALRCRGGRTAVRKSRRFARLDGRSARRRQMCRALPCDKNTAARRSGRKAPVSSAAGKTLRRTCLPRGRPAQRRAICSAPQGRGHAAQPREHWSVLLSKCSRARLVGGDAARRFAQQRRRPGQRRTLRAALHRGADAQRPA